MTEPLAALILSAGKGSRLKSAKPKVLHQIANRPMIRHVLDAVGALEPSRLIVVVGPDMDDVAKAAAPAETVIQSTQRGTGDAVAATRRSLNGFAGDVLVVYGDTPLLKSETLARLVAERRRGDAELGVFLVNVLMAPGVELAGPFPAELQQELVFTAAVAADSKEADAAKAFIDFLKTPAASAVFKASGMSPG